MCQPPGDLPGYPLYSPPIPPPGHPQKWPKMGVFRGVAENAQKWPILADFGAPGKSCNFCKFRAFSGTPIFAIFGDFLPFRLKKIWFWRSKNGPKMAKKCRILSRLGELLNTQRNVHFLASRPAAAAPRGRGRPEASWEATRYPGGVLRTPPPQDPLWVAMG